MNKCFNCSRSLRGSFKDFCSNKCSTTWLKKSNKQQDLLRRGVPESVANRVWNE